MEQRPFGKTGEQFSILSFGAQRIVDEHGCSEEEVLRMVNHALDRGMRYFDTAWIYSLQRPAPSPQNVTNLKTFCPPFYDFFMPNLLLFSKTRDIPREGVRDVERGGCMVFDEKLVDRIRKLLAGQKGLAEKKMFGGIAFMLLGNMCCGVIKDDLVVRVGPERYERMLAEPHVRPMDFTGRPVKGFVFVGRGGYKADEALAKWVTRAVDFTSSLPAK